MHSSGFCVVESKQESDRSSDPSTAIYELEDYLTALASYFSSKIGIIIIIPIQNNSE